MVETDAVHCHVCSENIPGRTICSAHVVVALQPGPGVGSVSAVMFGGDVPHTNNATNAGGEPVRSTLCLSWDGGRRRAPAGAVLGGLLLGGRLETDLAQQPEPDGPLNRPVRWVSWTTNSAVGVPQQERVLGVHPGVGGVRVPGPFQEAAAPGRSGPGVLVLLGSSMPP